MNPASQVLQSALAKPVLQVQLPAPVLSQLAAFPLQGSGSHGSSRHDGYSMYPVSQLSQFAPVKPVLHVHDPLPVLSQLPCPLQMSGSCDAKRSVK